MAIQPGLAVTNTPAPAIYKEKRVKVNKGLSKHRRGFPIKLSLDNVLMLHITHVWMQKFGETTADVDELVLALPPIKETGNPCDHASWQIAHRAKTYRFRGPQITPLIKLMERAATLPFTSCSVFRSRIRDLKALNLMDLMVDAQRE